MATARPLRKGNAAAVPRGVACRRGVDQLVGCDNLSHFRLQRRVARDGRVERCC